MDIFLTDNDPEVCAATLCDQHLLLQIHDAGTIFSTALFNMYGVTGYGEILKKKNRVVDWADTEEKVTWLAIYNTCLMHEYLHRFGEETVPCQFGNIVAGSHLMKQITLCGRTEEEVMDLELPRDFWIQRPFSTYQRKLTGYLKKINCAWTNSMPPYWLRKSGISLKREGDRIFKRPQ